VDPIWPGGLRSLEAARGAGKQRALNRRRWVPRLLGSLLATATLAVAAGEIQLRYPTVVRYGSLAFLYSSTENTEGNPIYFASFVESVLTRGNKSMLSIPNGTANGPENIMRDCSMRSE